MGNGSPHETCLVHTKIQADIEKVCRETGECNEDRKAIWSEVGKKPTIRLMCWVVGIIVSIFMAFMSTGFYVLSAQISGNTNNLKKVDDKISEVTTKVEVIKTQTDSIDRQLEKIDKRVERIEHNNKQK